MTTCRIMTYNVHGCVGTDGRLDLNRIAEVIALYNPDVVALQELIWPAKEVMANIKAD